MTRLIWLLLWIAVVAPARAADSGLLEDSAPLRVTIGNRAYALESLIVRPSQGARFPVAIIVHGAADSDGQLRDYKMTDDRQWARSLASRGWLAASVARRGYAGSEGTPFLNPGTCQEPAAAAYFDHHADEVEAIARAVAERSDSDMSKLLLLGKSTGGAIALDVAGRRKVIVTAVINVSGGLTTQTPRLTINPRCDLFQSDVVWNFARFGAVSQIPTLWIYAENDPWFSPAFVGRLHIAYTSAGGQAKLVMLPAFAPGGHDLYNAFPGQMQLLPPIDDFLRANGLTTWDIGLRDKLLARLNSAQRNAAVEYLTKAPAQKALAAGDGDSTVAWWSSDSDSADAASAQALHHCEEDAHRSCHVVAVNYTLVAP